MKFVVCSLLFGAISLFIYHILGSMRCFLPTRRKFCPR